MPKFEFFGESDSRSASPLSLISVLKALMVSYGFTFVVFTIFALLITYTPLPDSIMGAVVFVTMVLSVMIAGFMVGKRASSRGWLNGAVGGLLHVFILYIIGAMFVTGLVFDSHVAVLLLIGFLSGAFGGIVGINIKKK